MSVETTIQLPPPRKPGTKRVPDAVWFLWIFAALISGLAAGIYMGKKLVPVRSVVVKTPPPAVVTPKAPVAPPQAVGELLTAAQDATTASDWLRAQSLYQQVLASDADNAVAKAALPLIERHLASARGTVRIDTVPAGATVKLGSLGEKASPAVFEGVPFGEHEITISLAGFEPFTQVLTVNGPVTELAGIDLSRSTGELRLSSIPEGVEYRLVRTDGPEELVKIGKTPATIPQLQAGEYQVHMALSGWPDYREKVQVESNRKASVSHIFARGGLKVTSDPIDAEVWLTTDASLPPRKLGVTPLMASELPVGRHRLELRYRDWAPIQRTVEVREGEPVELDFAWKRGTVAFTSDPAGARVLLRDEPIGSGDGQQGTPFTAELPEGTHTFVAQFEGLEPVTREVEVRADTPATVRFEFAYGSVSIVSEPPGATVIAAGRPLGRTPYRQQIVRPGPQSYDLSLPNHRSTQVAGEVKPGLALNFDAKLTFDPVPKTQSDFSNSLGLQMKWVDELHGWVGAHEVPQAAFEAVMRKNPSPVKGANLPAQGMTWYDASRFCEQLTASERSSGRLPKGYRYRLPTDQMWSLFAGDAGLEQAVTSSGSRREGPSPVGSLPANALGLHDVRGNVWEWCEDWYSLDIVNRARDAGASTNNSWVGTERKVLRGGSWNRSSTNDLHREYRYGMRPSTADSHEIGFRVVLMPD
ncbi:MAG: PEGA domain-containing protein [Verrucomicrobiales bacterium]|nr:PEGA domain-containing protein [Verrucomicrobiales bacterium]